MKRFSQRIGVEEVSTSLQIDSMNNDLKNSLWNVLLYLYNRKTNNYWLMVADHVAVNFRKSPADEVPYLDYDCREWLKEYFFSLKWYGIYNFIEFLVENHETMSRISSGHSYKNHDVKNIELKSILNDILERELSGFRFISGSLTPISDKIEQTAILDALTATEDSGLSGANEHLNTALRLLGKKPDPDYRNSIKESISAVESITKKFTGKKSNGLDGAIEELAKQSELHGALKAGFKSLYGFTSDTDGVRHAILDQPNVSFAEAKYMLVSCSAFVHYLIEKADQASLLDKE